jgi:hypothetical protein
MQPPLHPVLGTLTRHASEARLRVHFHSANPLSEVEDGGGQFSRAATLSSVARTPARTDDQRQETANAVQSGSGFLFQRVTSVPKDYSF